MADETTVTKNLWTEHMGKGFAAKQSDYAIRASEDVDGNRIDTTYATKTELASKADKLVPATGTIESGAVSLQNNKVTSIEIPSDSSATSLTLDCTVAAGECANFACEITNNSSETVTLTLTLNSVAGSTHRAAATDGKVESGKFYQLTCAGTCWTLAEFTSPS